MKQPKVVQVIADKDGLIRGVLYDDGKVFALNPVFSTTASSYQFQWSEFPLPIRNSEKKSARMVERRQKPNKE